MGGFIVIIIICVVVYKKYKNSDYYQEAKKEEERENFNREYMEKNDTTIKHFAQRVAFDADLKNKPWEKIEIELGTDPSFDNDPYNHSDRGYNLAWAEGITNIVVYYRPTGAKSFDPKKYISGRATTPVGIEAFARYLAYEAGGGYVRKKQNRLLRRGGTTNNSSGLYVDINGNLGYSIDFDRPDNKIPGLYTIGYGIFPTASNKTRMDKMLNK